jgi:hypothetical protein
VLPDGAQHSKDVPWNQAPGRFRRVGVSEGRLRYVEVSRKEPFVLSSFVLDDDDEECTGWRSPGSGRIEATHGYH